MGEVPASPQMPQDFEANCNACLGLCCIALSFTRAQGFGHDKPEGVPCHLLAGDLRCTIHARRELLGYDGCVDFDCRGAGQRATAAFAHQNWKGNPAIARALHIRFSHLLRVQEMRMALIEAAELDLRPVDHVRRCMLLEQLDQLVDEQTADFVAVDIDALIAEGKHMIKTWSSRD
jgi:hypothetical protein